RLGARLGELLRRLASRPRFRSHPRAGLAAKTCALPRVRWGAPAAPPPERFGATPPADPRSRIPDPRLIGRLLVSGRRVGTSTFTRDRVAVSRLPRASRRRPAPGVHWAARLR